MLSSARPVVATERRLRPPLLLRCLVLVLALQTLPVLAQQRLLWDARRLLSVNSPVIELTNKGLRVGSVLRADLVRAVEITNRLADSLSIAAPEVLVTQDASPNAFVTFNNERKPIMAVNTEMFRMTSGDENKLAAVIGHELSHLKANHLTDGRNAKIAINVIGLLLGAAVDVNQARRGRDTGGLGAVLGSTGGALVSAAYNRDQEREADNLGQEAMARAGYDPRAVPRLWQLMAARGTSTSGLWFDSHPSAPEREQTATAAAHRLQHTYEANARRFDQERLHTALALSEMDPFPPSRYATIAPTADEIEAGSAYARATKALEALDFAEAMRLFKDASAADDERATYVIGLMVARGDGVSADPRAALTLFTLSAESGFTPAIVALASASWAGRGRDQDTAEALRLYRVAARRGYEPATANLALMYAEGLAPHDIQRDLRVAKLLAEQSLSTPTGKAVLGTVLLEGADPAAGIALLEEAAPRLPYARYRLGLAYEHGMGAPRDRTRAIIEYEKAAADGSTAARDRLQFLNAR